MQTAAIQHVTPRRPPISAIEPGEDDRADAAPGVGANPELPKSVCPPATYNPLAAGLAQPRSAFRDPERARELSRAKAVLAHIRDGYRPEEFAGELQRALERGLISQNEIAQATCVSGEKRARAALRAVRYGGNVQDPRIKRMLDEGFASGFLTVELLDQAHAYAQTRNIRAWP